MQQVDIFLVTSTKSPGRHRRAWYKYILVCSGRSLEEKTEVRNLTGHQIILQCAIAAMNRMQKPSMITIHTDSYYLASAQMKFWEDNQWRRGNGEMLKNADLWKKLREVTRPHAIRFRVESMDPYDDSPSR